MKRSILGFLVVLTGLVMMGCPDQTMDLPPDPAMPALDQVVNLLAIPGVVAPVQGAAPVTTPIDTAQYTGTIAWAGSPGTFAPTTVYTANIALTTKAGWTLTGVAANSFTVAGATATNALDSGIVVAVFPATGTGDYTSVNIGILKYVPAGSFQRDGDAANISTITTAFRMSQYEITRAQFAARFEGNEPSEAAYSSGTSDPVQNANWYHAIAFCNKLSLAEGFTPVYSVTGVDFATLTYAEIPTDSNADWDAAIATWTNNGYRLPTEMEWMWAAMGSDTANPGATNTTGYLKAFAGSTGSNDLWAFAVFGYYGRETGRTTTEGTNPVGSKTANELGLYDLSGNVIEWCWDWYADNGTQPNYAITGTVTSDSAAGRGAASGTDRVLRGGSWNDPAIFCAAAFRLCTDPNLQFRSIGFRVVRP